MSSYQEIKKIQTQVLDCCCNEEERELEEALSLSDLPINTGNEQDGANQEETKNEGDDFDFGSLIGSINALEGEMCAADEVFSGGQMLPYRNSVSSMTGLQSISRSESMKGFGSRSSSSRSSSIRSHYSTTSSSGSSNCSYNTTISSKTVPLVIKSKVVQNQFHSYPSPKPQILGSGPRYSTHATSIGKKSKMWEVLKLGLVRTPEIELQDLKLRHHHRTNNNFGKTFIIPRNNSSGSNSSTSNNDVDRDRDRARKSYSIDGSKISDFVLDIQKRKNKLSELQKNSTSSNNSGFFKSCKCTIGVIEPIPLTSGSNNNGVNKFGKGQKFSPAATQVFKEEKNLTPIKHQQLMQEEQQQQQQQQHQQKRKQDTSHHHNRTFEWLKNLSHATVLNS